MRFLSLSLLLMLVSSCTERPSLILWDYENKVQIREFSIIDSDSIVQPKKLLRKENLEKIEPHKFFVIKSEGYYSEDLDMYGYMRKKKDTIYFSQRIQSKIIPPKFESDLFTMKYKERSNKSFVQRDANIEALKLCLAPLKEKYNADKLWMSVKIHKNGDVLDYQIYENIVERIPIDKSERKDCFVNLGAVIYGTTARSGSDRMTMTIII